MEIVLSRLEVEDRDASFEIFKTYLKPFIDDAFAWDEEFQRNGFESHLHAEWFSWVLTSKEKMGLVCKRWKDSSLHIHLLVTFTSAQRTGIATSVMLKLKAEAAEQNKDLTLSCFKNNDPALRLYKSLGFVVASEDEYFYEFTSKREPT